MRQHLIDKISVFLLKKGYAVKSIGHGFFDLLARRNEAILLLKILEDANSIGREVAREMTEVASYIDASPLIVAEKAGQKLESNVVYIRFGIYTINFATLENCIESRFPFFRKTNAGLTASISGKKIKGMREEIGLSANAMSRKIGVSGKTAKKYEQGISEVTLAKAMKIYDIFGEAVFGKINIFKRDYNLQSNARSEISKKYIDIGFNASDTKKAPFDIIAKKNRVVVITAVGDKINPDSIMVSKLMDADALVIFEKKKPKDIAAIKKKEFLEFEESDELIKLLKEF